MIVRVKQVLEDNCYGLTMFQGLRLYKILFEELKKNNSITIDFYGIRVCSSEFLENAIGRLLMDFKKEYLFDNLKYIFHSEHDKLKSSIGAIIINAERYYTDEKHRKKLDAAYKKYDLKNKRKVKDGNKKVKL